MVSAVHTRRTPLQSTAVVGSVRIDHAVPKNRHACRPLYVSYTSTHEWLTTRNGEPSQGIAVAI
jgi:hypothetical protein